MLFHDLLELPIRQLILLMKEVHNLLFLYISYKVLIKSGAIFLDFPEYLIVLIDSKLDLSLPTKT